MLEYKYNRKQPQTEECVMSKKEGYSRRGFFGEIKHYDANGRKIGESRPGFFGCMNNYDATSYVCTSFDNGR